MIGTSTFCYLRECLAQSSCTASEIDTCVAVPAVTCVAALAECDPHCQTVHLWRAVYRCDFHGTDARGCPQVCGYLGLCDASAVQDQPEKMAVHRKLLATAIAKQAQQQKLTLGQVKEDLHKGLQVMDGQTCQLCTMAVTYAKVRIRGSIGKAHSAHRKILRIGGGVLCINNQSDLASHQLLGRGRYLPIV